MISVPRILNANQISVMTGKKKNEPLRQGGVRAIVSVMSDEVKLALSLQYDDCRVVFNDGNGKLNSHTPVNHM